MATLSDIYNKVKLSEDLADKGMATTAERLTSNPNLMSPYALDGIEQAIGATTSTNYNPVESGLSAASGFVRSVGGLPVLDQIANPIADSLDNLHSQGYQATQLARQAKSDSFDEKNNAKYVSDLANGRSVATASLAKIGREAVNYLSGSNAQDIIDDTASAAGSIGGSFVLGGFIGKVAKTAYAGLASARLATTAEAKMAQYNSAMQAAEAAKAGIAKKLSSTGISTTERDALVQQSNELDALIQTASQERKELLAGSRTARADLSAKEFDRQMYGATADDGYQLNHDVLAAQEAVEKATADLKANKKLLNQAKKDNKLISDYIKEEDKYLNAKQHIDKMPSLMERAGKMIDTKATKFGNTTGGNLVNFGFGASTAMNNEDLDKVSLNDFKQFGSEDKLSEFNKLKQEYIAKGLTEPEAEEKAFDSIKSSLKLGSAIKTGLWEAAVGKITGRAHKQGQGIKGILTTKAKDYAGETVEELGQTAGENVFSNLATQQLDVRKEATDNLGRELAQTAISVPGGMAALNAGNLTASTVKNVGKGAYTIGKALSGARAHNSIAEAVNNTDSSKRVSLPSDVESRVSYAKNQEGKQVVTDLVSKYESDLKAVNADRDLSFLSKIKDGIKDHKDIIETRNSILDEINNQTGIIKSDTASDEDKKIASLNVIDLVKLAKGLNDTVTYEGDNPNQNVHTFKKEYNRRLAEKIKDLDLDKEVIPVLKDALHKEVSKLSLPENQSEEIINQNLDQVRSTLSVANMLISADTSKEEIQALADMSQELTKINPSYAQLPEAQILNSKVELAKAYGSWIEKSNNTFQGIYERTPNSEGKISKHDTGFYDKNSLKQYMGAVSDILSDANLDDKDSIERLNSLIKGIKEFYDSQESKINQVSKVLEDIRNNNLKGYNIKDNILTYSGISNKSYTVPFNLKISLTGKNENGAYTPQTTEARYLEPIRQEQEIIIAIGAATRGLREALKGKPLSFEPRGKGVQSDGTGSGKYFPGGIRKANADACNALANSFTEKNEGTDTKGDSISSLTYNGPDQIPFTFTKNKDVPPVHLQVKKEFLPYSGDTRFDTRKGSNTSTYKNGRYLKLAFKFAATYAIENQDERLKAQKKLFEEAEATGLKNKLTNGQYAPKYGDLFTEESLKNAGIDPTFKVGYTQKKGKDYPTVTLFTGKGLNEVNYKFDFAESIYSGILKENLGNKQKTSNNTTTEAPRAETTTATETKPVVDTKPSVAETTTEVTETPEAPTVTEDQVYSDLPTNAKEAVNLLNRINQGLFTFKDITSKEITEVVDMILDYFKTDEVSKTVTNAVSYLANNILSGINKALEHNQLTAEEFNSNGLFRFLTFEENNGKITAKWATINGESVENRVKASLALTLLTTEFTRDKRLNQLVEEFTENDTETVLYAKDLFVKLNNKTEIDWNQAVGEFKNTSLVSLNSFGSVLANYLRAFIPVTASDVLTPSGGKYAHDTLANTIINMFKQDYQVKDKTVKRTEGNIHYFTVFHQEGRGDTKKADDSNKARPLGQVIALPNIGVQGIEKVAYRKALKVANEALAGISEEAPVEMHVGTKPLDALGKHKKLRHTKLETSDAEKKALKNLAKMPHEVTTYGNFISKVSQSAYVEAILPSTEYLSENASTAQRAKVEQLAKAHTEVLDTKNLVAETQKGTTEPVYIYYGNDYTKVHRLNASHYDSYRNNKTVRESVAPSKMQVSMDSLRKNTKALMLWKRAVVQGFGDKVQNITDISSTFNNYLDLVHKLPENQQKLLVDAFTTNADGSKELDKAFIALGSLLRDNGIEVTEVALHNAVELLAYSDGKEFKSSVYGEADGITNGIFFSMLMDAVYNSQSSTALHKHITNLARVGMFLGINQDTDNPEHGFYGNAVSNLQKDSLFEDAQNDLPDLMVNGKTQDIYTTVATLVSEAINTTIGSIVPLQAEAPAEKIGNTLNDLTKFLLSYLNVKVNNDGTLEVSRTAVKLPVTQANYSAGIKSIADSMSKELAGVWDRGLGTKSDKNSGISLFMAPISTDEAKKAGIFLNKELTTIVNNVVKMISTKVTHEEIFNYLKTASKVNGITIVKAPFDAVEQNNLVREFVDQVKIQCAVGFLANCQTEYDNSTKKWYWNEPALKQDKQGAAYFAYKNPLALSFSEVPTLNVYSLKNVARLLQSGYVDMLFNTINNVLGEDKESPLVKVIPMITEKVFQYRDKVTKEVYADALIKRGVLNKDTAYDKETLISMAHRKLPEREIKGLNKQIRDKVAGVLTQLSPSLGSTDSQVDFTLLKSDRVVPQSITNDSAFNITNSNRVRYTPEVTVDASGGVSARPNGNIGLGDGATMTDAINLMSKLGIHFQDIFDGINLSALTYADKENINQRINKIASYKALHTNPILGFIQVWDQIKGAFKEGKVLNRMSQKAETASDEIDTIERALNDANCDISMGHAILNSGVIPFTCNQYAFNPEGAYSKRPEFTVNGVTYTYTQDLTIEQTSNIYSYMYSLARDAFDQVIDPKQAYQDTPKFLAEKINNDSHLLDFLASAGVTVVPLSEVKPKAKPKPRKTLKDLNIKKRMAKVEFDKDGYCSAVNLLKNDLLTSSKNDKKRIAYHALLKLLGNNKLTHQKVLILSKEEVMKDKSLVSDNQLAIINGLSAGNAVFIPNDTKEEYRSIIVYNGEGTSEQGTNDLIMHELFHAMFKRTIYKIFGEMRVNQLFDNNGRIRTKDLVKELVYGTDENSKKSERDLTTLFESLNAIIDESAKTKKNYVSQLRAWVEKTSGKAVDFIDELCIQAIMPTDDLSKQIKKDYGFLAHIADALLVSGDTLSTVLKRIWEGISARRGKANPGAILLSLISLSNFRSIDVNSPLRQGPSSRTKRGRRTKQQLRQSYAFIPTNEDLQKVLETKPEKFNRLVKAFSYNNNNYLQELLTQYEDNEGNSRITLDQATRWAMYDDIVKNKAMSDTALLTLSKIHDALIKSEEFKKINPDIKELLIGHVGNVINASFGRKTETSPIANMMFLAEISPEVKDLMSKVKLPDALNNKLHYKVDQWINDATAKAYNSLLNKANLSERYDHLLAKICSDNATISMAQRVFDTASQIENRANSLVHNMLSAGVGKVASNIAKHTKEGSVHSLASAVALIHEADKTHDLTDTFSFLGTLATQAMNLPNAAMHLLQDLSSANLDTFEPLAFFKKTKAQFDKIKNQIAKEVPANIKAEFKNLTKEEEAVLNNVVLKLDLSCLLSSGSSAYNINNLIENENAKEIAEDLIKQTNLNREQIKRIKQLAHYLATGKTGGEGLLRNAYAIAHLTKTSKGYLLDPSKTVDRSYVTDIDRIISLLALSEASPDDLSTLHGIITRNYTGMRDFIDFHISIKNQDLRTMEKNPQLMFNYSKGYLPQNISNQVSVQVVNSAEKAQELSKLGYSTVKILNRNPGDHSQGKIYIMRSAIPESAYRQGIIKQNATSIYGLTNSGYAKDNLLSIKVGNYVPSDDNLTEFNPIPVFNAKGEVTGYSMDFSSVLEEAGIAKDTNPFGSLGMWHGNAFTFEMSKSFNLQLVKLNTKMLTNDIQTKSANLVNKAWHPISYYTSKDRVIADAWSHVPTYVKDAMAKEQKCGTDEIQIRQDMVDLFLGYRTASVTDFFTGISRWNPKTCNAVAKLAVNILGKDAYKYLAGAERAIQYTSAYARNVIVVRSIVVPFYNICSNILQLRMRGIPLEYIAEKIATKTLEAEQYNTLLNNQLKIRAKIATFPNPNDQGAIKLKRRLEIIEDKIGLLSINPMIEAGELSTINDVGDDYNQSVLTGNWANKLNEEVGKLPDQMVQAGKWLLVSKDTAMYKLLEKATIYGDFVAKSIYYDWLTEHGTQVNDALIKSMNEFVNYDILAGRNREYLENMGVLMFYNYTLRSLRTAFDIMLHNPVSALLALHMFPDFMTQNSVLTDSFLGKLASGNLGNTFMNPSLLAAPITKNPFLIPVM